jgi:hypothetical protein
MDLHAWLDARYVGHDSRQVPLEVQTQSQKIRHYQNFRSAASGQARNSLGQVRRALFEERGFNQEESALPGHAIGYGAHGLVR